MDKGLGLLRIQLNEIANPDAPKPLYVFPRS